MENTSTRKRVFCLYRVSTKGQVDEKEDIPMQRNACHAFSDAKGWEIVNERYEKGVSGYKVSAKKRDEIINMQRAANEKRFDVLLVFMFDRIGRRDDETPFVVEWFVKQGIEVWSVTEGQQRFDNHTDKLLNYLRYWQASGESIKTSQRLKETFQQLIENGVWPGGVVPFGYKKIHKGRINKKGHPVYDLEIDEAEAGIIRQLFYKTANEGLGTHRLAEWANEQKIFSHNGSKWQCNTVYRILKNPIYTGYLVTKTARSKNQILDLVIIEPELFMQTQEILHMRRTKNTEKKINPTDSFCISTYLLSGKLYCGDCNTKLSVSTHNDKYLKKNGALSEKLTRRYICYHNARSLNNCRGQTSYKAEKVELAVIDILKIIFSYIKMMPEDKMLELRCLQQIEDDRERIEKCDNSIEASQKVLKALKDEILNVITGMGKFSSEILNELISQKELEIKTLMQEKKNIKSEAENKEARIKAFRIQFKQFKSWSEEFELCSDERKQTIIVHLVDRIEIERGYKIKVHLNDFYKQFISEAILTAA